MRPDLEPDDPRHGRYTTYNNLRCRCGECRQAWREYVADYRTKKREQQETTDEQQS